MACLKVLSKLPGRPIIMKRSDAICIAVILSLTAVYIIQRVDNWCRCASVEEATEAAELMRSWRWRGSNDRREIEMWVRANRAPLQRKIGRSVTVWLMCVDAENGVVPGKKHAREFIDLMIRAANIACKSSDIDQLWAVYYVTGDPAVVDLIRDQLRSPRGEIREKTAWSLRQCDVA